MPCGTAGLYRESPVVQLLPWQWAQADWAVPKPGEVAGQVLLLQVVQQAFPRWTPEVLAGAAEAPAEDAGPYRESPVVHLTPRQWAQAAGAAPKPGAVAAQFVLALNWETIALLALLQLLVVSSSGAAEDPAEAPVVVAELYRESPLVQLLPWEWIPRSVSLFRCHVLLVSPF